MNLEVDRSAITLLEGQTDIGLRNPSEEGYPQQPDLLKIAHFMAINNANISSFNRKEVVDAIKEGKNVTKIRDVFYTPDEYGLYIPEKDRIEVSLQIETNKLFELIEKRDKRLREIEILKQYLNNPRNNGRPHDLKSIEGQIESLKKRLQNLNSVLRRELMDNNPPPQPEPTVDKFAHLFRGLSDIEDHDNGKDSLPPGVTAGIVVAGAIGLTNSKLRKGAYVATAIATASGLVLSACQPQPPAIVQQEQGDATQDPLVHDGNKPTVTFVSENPTSEPSPSPTPITYKIAEGGEKGIGIEIYGKEDPDTGLKESLGSIKLYDVEGNVIKEISDDVYNEIGNQLDSLNGQVYLTNLSGIVSKAGEITWKVVGGDKTYPPGTYIQLIKKDNGYDLRFHTLEGATHDLNQFRNENGRSLTKEEIEKNIEEHLQIFPDTLKLTVNEKGEIEVIVIKEGKVIGGVDENGNWSRVKMFEISKDGKTIWIWDKGLPAEGKNPRISPAMVLDQENSKLLQAHGGIIKNDGIKEIGDGLYEFTMNDGTVIGVQVKDGKVTLIAKEREKQEFYHFEPVEGTDQDIRDINYSIISRIAGGEYSVQAKDLLSRSLKLSNGARVLLSKEIYENLLSQIPEGELSNMTPQELNKEIAKLAGQSEWAETLEYFTNKENINKGLGRNYLSLQSGLTFFILPDGTIACFGEFPESGGFVQTLAILNKKQKGNDTEYTRQGLSKDQLLESYLSKRDRSIPVDFIWSEKLNRLVKTDGYIATSYFDTETSSWKKVEPSQMRDYKVLTPEQEKEYIKYQLHHYEASYNKGQPYIFNDQITSERYPQTFILKGGKNGFDDGMANQLLESLEFILDNSETARKYYLEKGEVRYIANSPKKTMPINYSLNMRFTSMPTNVGNIYGFVFCQEMIRENNATTDIKPATIFFILHEMLRIIDSQLYSNQEEHDQRVFKLTTKILEELKASGHLSEGELRVIYDKHNFSKTYMNISN